MNTPAQPVCRSSAGACLSRRTLVAMAAMAPILTACGSTGAGTAAEPLDDLFIRYPQTLAFSAPFLLVRQGGVLEQYARSVDVGEAPSAEMLGSMLVNGEAEVIAAPTHVGASLANEGYAVSLAAVLVWGNLWLLGPEDAAPEWSTLRGQKITVPLPNDVPDLVFQVLADANKLGKYDYQVEHHADPAEVVARVERGDARWAVLPEHLATVALNQANDGHAEAVIICMEAWAGGRWSARFRAGAWSHRICKTDSGLDPRCRRTHPIGLTINAAGPDGRAISAGTTVSCAQGGGRVPWT